MLPVPLLSLAAPALALGEDLAFGDYGESTTHNVGDIWNVSKTAHLVKDGSRLENIAWRHWSSRERRLSTSTASTVSITTPELSPKSRSFGSALRLVMEEDNFRDWVGDAKRNIPLPMLSVPDTPVANVEIRLVEPTPVPSRVGSLGASLVSMRIAPTPDELEEEVIMDEPIQLEVDKNLTGTVKVKKKGKFFVQSSPTKSGSSDTSHTSPIPSEALQPLHRNSSGSSSDASKTKAGSSPEPIKLKAHKEKRHVSLSTMRGKFGMEKRKAAEALRAKDEGSGWEDDDEEAAEDWSDEDSPVKATSPARSLGEIARQISRPELTRQVSRRTPPKHYPPPPAPTPLRKMSKKERLAAAADRVKIEAELDAQRKREMFAKQQIFGSKSRSPGEGLLTGLFKRGGSMVDLTQAPAASIRPSPTHGHLPSLARSPLAGPNMMIRSKSAIAMPVQTGVSVTSHAASHSSNGSKRGPGGEVMESSGEESDDDYLATSQTKRKIEELSAKQNVKAQLVPGQRLDENGVVLPTSPTTKRREIIMREMSESLRRNLVLERQKSSGARQNSFGQTRPPPSTHISHLPSRSSATDLRYTQGAPLARHQSQPTPSQPTVTSQPAPPPERPPDPPRRRQQQTVLGGGFLRPLTRVGENAAISRTQSSANLEASASAAARSPSPVMPSTLEAPAMMRRSTEGDPRDTLHESRKRELAKRSETMDTSYRIHGW